MLNMVDKEKGM